MMVCHVQQLATNSQDEDDKGLETSVNLFFFQNMIAAYQIRGNEMYHNIIYKQIFHPNMHS